MNETLKDRLTSARIKILKKSPFFGTLLLHSETEVCEDIGTLATDGEKIFISTSFINSLGDAELQGALIHEVMHIALKHMSRMKLEFTEDAYTANIACDIVVNGIIEDNGFKLPPEVVRDNKLKHLSAKEIYKVLKQQKKDNKKSSSDNYGSCNQCMGKLPDNSSGQGDNGDSEEKGSSNGPSSKVKTNWDDVLKKAVLTSKMKNYGLHGAGLNRIVEEMLDSSLNWKDILYKYITSYKTDFQGFDRRFINEGLYLDDLDGDKLNVLVFIDTSGSVDDKLLSEFLGEIRFAVGSIPKVTGHVWSFDTNVYDIGDIEDVLDGSKIKFKGGGGTDFSPVTKFIDKRAREEIAERTLGIIFTDGYAPESWPIPECDLVWCISPGGIDKMKYGEVVRMV